MNLCILPSVFPPPTSSLFTVLYFGCSSSPMPAWKRSAELLRSKLSSRSFLPLEPSWCSPSFSHLRVRHSPGRPNPPGFVPELYHLRVKLLLSLPAPPPEPPDPPDPKSCPSHPKLVSTAHPLTPDRLNDPLTPSYSLAPPVGVSGLESSDRLLSSSSFLVVARYSDPFAVITDAPSPTGLVIGSGTGTGEDLFTTSLRLYSRRLASWAWAIIIISHSIIVKASPTRSHVIWAWPNITIKGFTSSAWFTSPVRLTPQKTFFCLVAAEASRSTVFSPWSPPFPDKLIRVLKLLLLEKVILMILPGGLCSLTFLTESKMHPCRRECLLSSDPIDRISASSPVVWPELLLSPLRSHYRVHFQSRSVLFLAGEGTSGSWIPVFVSFHILFRRCTLSIASSVLKKLLPRKLCYMVTRVSFWERVSSPSFMKGKRITFVLILSMKGELFSVSKPKIFSSFMERVLLSYASMAMAKVEQADYDHVVVVLGLKKADVKSTSFGGVLRLASGNEFSTRILCSGNSASLSISKEESIHGGYSEFILLFSFFFVSLVVLYCNFSFNSYVGSLPPLRGVTQV